MNASLPFLITLAACTAAVSFLTLPLWRRVCLRAGLVDDPGHRKIHDQPVPLAGGLAILTALVLAGLGTALASEELRGQLAARSGELACMIVGVFVLSVTGLLDDWLELRPAWKLAGQSAAALLMAAGLPFNLPPPWSVVAMAVTALWIVTVTNAFNFTDNMNGLCAGLAAVAAAGFGFEAAREGRALEAAAAFLVCGAAAGFLPWNFPRASAFLGDGGSHLLGGLLALLGVWSFRDALGGADGAAAAPALSPFLILAVPLADMAVVVWRRWRAGRPVYVGDTNHFSHRLVRRGLSPARAVLVLWLLAALGALAAAWWR